MILNGSNTYFAMQKLYIYINLYVFIKPIFLCKTYFGTCYYVVREGCGLCLLATERLGKELIELRLRTCCTNRETLCWILL